MQAVRNLIDDFWSLFEVGPHNRRKSYRPAKAVHTESQREECARDRYLRLDTMYQKTKHDLELFQVVAVIEFLTILAMFVALAI